MIASRGEHEAEDAIAALRAEPDPACALQQAPRLVGGGSRGTPG